MKENYRISLIASLIDKTEHLIDVGTDHAYLPIYCLENNIASNVTMTDINDGPMINALKNVKKHGFENRITSIISDGLEDVIVDKNSTIVIAGMGGELISEILDKSLEKIDRSNTLILQPQTSHIDLKKYLFENGFSIINELYFCLKGFSYVAFKVVYNGFIDIIDKFDKRLFIPIDGNYDKEALKMFLNKSIKRQKKILKGYELTDPISINEQTKLIKELIKYYESI